MCTSFSANTCWVFSLRLKTPQSNLSLSVEIWKAKSYDNAKKEKEIKVHCKEVSYLLLLLLLFQMCLRSVTSQSNVMCECINPRISLYFCLIADRGVKIHLGVWFAEPFLKNSNRWWASLLQNLIKASQNQCRLSESELAKHFLNATRHFGERRILSLVPEIDAFSRAGVTLDGDSSLCSKN